MVAKTLQVSSQQLTEVYNFKLKGTGPIAFHLGCDYFRDANGVLCLLRANTLRKCCRTTNVSLERHEAVYFSLEKGDHPELDDSRELTVEEIKTYQSLIGSLQWAIQMVDLTSLLRLCRSQVFEQTHVLVTSSGFNAFTVTLSKMRHGTVRIRTMEPDYSDIPIVEYDWSRTVYGDVKKLFPKMHPNQWAIQLLLQRTSTQIFIMIC